MKNRLVCACFLLMVMANSIHAGSLAQFGVIDRNNAFFSLLGIPLWDPSELATSYVNPDGTFWVKSDEDGRIRAGTWQLGADGKICLTVGGVYEGCFETSRHGNIVRFYLPEADFAFTQQPRKDLPADFLSKEQKRIYKQLTEKRGALDTGRGGDEYIYWHKNGLIFVVQPEGWIKTGGWWFKSNGRICDNVDGGSDCYSVKKLRDDVLILIWHSEGGDVELNIRIEERPDSWPGQG